LSRASKFCRAQKRYFFNDISARNIVTFLQYDKIILNCYILTLTY